MALLVPDAGEVELASRMLNKSATGDVRLKLFSTNVTPAESDVHATYTESSWTGYTAGGTTLTGASWTVSTVTGTTTATYTEVTFTSTAGSQSANNYGYYVENSGQTILLWAEGFGSNYQIVNNGDAIKITPKITLE